MSVLTKPPSFLTERCPKLSWAPTLRGLCVGYELKKWRQEALIDHIFNWIPEFALSAQERASLNDSTLMQMARNAVAIIYQTDRFAKRGEFGEIFLHAVIRQVHDSIPAISKMYFKSATNDTVKGFDAVHVVGPPSDLELWLGEVKFYGNISNAISAAVKELEQHLEASYLKEEFLLISNKVDERASHASALKRLLAPETSLDEVFKRVCVPVMITYDSACVAAHNECSDEYVAAFDKEVTTHYNTFAKAMKKRALPKDIRFHLYLMPLQEKKALVEALHRRLKLWQSL